MAEMTVQIVTPDGLKYDHHAKFILVKTPNGELGVLACLLYTSDAADE